MGSFELRIIELSAQHIGIDTRNSEAVLRRQPEPRPGFKHVGIDTVTMHITGPKCILRYRQATMRRAAPQFDAGRYVARHAALPASIEDAEVVGRARLASVGGLLPPAVRLDEIARHPRTSEIHESEFVGGAHIALLRDAFEPGACLFGIGGHAFTAQIEQGEIVLRFSQALIGSASIPLRGLARISNHSPPFLVGQAEIKLRLRLTLAGERLEFTERHTIITGAKGGQARREICTRNIARKHPQKGGEHSASCTSVPHSR